MVFRTLLILVAFYLLYRLFSRRLFMVLSQPKKNKPIGQPGVIEDKIIPCPACGTYNPSRDAFFYEGNFYCNQSCFEKRGSPA